LDLSANIQNYLDGCHSSKGRKPDERYASFDYCFNYFQSFRESGKFWEIAGPGTNLQLSCLHLGFYLASWGMLRGSADLLQKSSRHLINVIEVVAGADPSLRELDAHCYTESNIQRLVKLAGAIRQKYPLMSDILVTKIMLGVFGSVPAFDANFKRGFGVAKFNDKALRKIAIFYQDHAEVLDTYRVPTLDFFSGEHTQRRYTRAKVIDMVFFIEGMNAPIIAPSESDIAPSPPTE
jgi:hypothetical protein